MFGHYTEACGPRPERFLLSTIRTEIPFHMRRCTALCRLGGHLRAVDLLLVGQADLRCNLPGHVHSHLGRLLPKLSVALGSLVGGNVSLLALLLPRLSKSSNRKYRIKSRLSVLPSWINDIPKELGKLSQTDRFMPIHNNDTKLAKLRKQRFSIHVNNPIGLRLTISNEAAEGRPQELQETKVRTLGPSHKPASAWVRSISLDSGCHSAISDLMNLVYIIRGASKYSARRTSSQPACFCRNPLLR